MSSVLPPVPAELPLSAIIVGTVLLVSGITYSIVAGNASRTQSGVSPGIAGGSLLLGASVLAVVIPLLDAWDATWVYAVFLFTLWRAFEGAIVVRSVQKIMYVVFERSLPGGFKQHLVRVVLVVSIVVATVGTILWLLRTNPDGATLHVLTVFTFGLFGVTGITVIHELRHIVGQLNPAISFGWVLCITGVELYDYPPLTGLVPDLVPLLQLPTGDIAIQLVGQSGYLLGILIASGILTKNILSGRPY